jgi:hypothetical protein
VRQIKRQTPTRELSTQEILRFPMSSLLRSQQQTLKPWPMWRPPLKWAPPDGQRQGSRPARRLPAGANVSQLGKEHSLSSLPALDQLHFFSFFPAQLQWPSEETPREFPQAQAKRLTTQPLIPAPSLPPAPSFLQPAQTGQPKQQIHSCFPLALASLISSTCPTLR